MRLTEQDYRPDAVTMAKALLGMTLCRHKTKHWYFVVFMPLILVLHIVLLGLLYYFFFR